MEFSVAIIRFGLILIVLGTLVQLVRAFQQSPSARAKGSLVCISIGVAITGLGGVISEKGLSANSLVAALTFSNDDKDIESLTASIEGLRTRIESLEDQFQVRGAELAKQFQMLKKRRDELELKDPATVQRFNGEAENYTAQNNAQKAIGVELESARTKLSGLLDERARLRALNPVAVASTPATETPSAPTGATDKRVVMYTTARCPACVAAKAYLGRRGVRYEERDVNRSSEARQEYQSLGGRGVPLILVGTERMDGFNAQRFEQMIGG